MENAFISSGQPHCTPSVWLLVPRSEHGVAKPGRDLQDPSVQASAQQGHGHPKSMVTPTPRPLLDTPRDGDSIPPWQLTLMEFTEYSGLDHWVQLQRKAQPGIKTQPWLCQHHLSSSQGLSIPSGGKQLRTGKCWARAALGLLLLLFVSLFVTCPWELLCILCWISTAAPHSVFMPWLVLGVAFWTSSELCYNFFLAISLFFRVFLNLPTQGTSPAILARCANVNWICFVLSCPEGHLYTRKQHLHENSNWRRFPYSESLVLNQGNILVLRERLCLITELILVAPLCYWGGFLKYFGTGYTRKETEYFLCSSPVSITTISHALTTLWYSCCKIKKLNTINLKNIISLARSSQEDNLSPLKHQTDTKSVSFLILKPMRQCGHRIFLIFAIILSTRKFS